MEFHIKIDNRKIFITHNNKIFEGKTSFYKLLKLNDIIELLDNNMLK